MKLSYNNRDELLRRLPDLKLSYENIHKKVFSEMYFLIPKGKKHLAWFTYFEDKKVCIFIELNQGTEKSIKDMYIVPQVFDKKMVLGTIFYGTLFTMNEKKFYSIENIHYYRGKNVEFNDEQYKLGLLRNIFEHDLKQTIITNRGICFGLPIIESSFENAIACAKQLPYEIYSIQNRDFNGKTNLYNSTLYKCTDVDENENKIFSVRPDIQNDVYHLYVRSGNNGNNLEFFDIAAIPDYKTSVMMNKLFRNIVENARLDAQEESEDEVEFENTEPDKYVSLHKEFMMVCQFHKRFCRWVPIQLSALQTSSLSHIITDQQVKQHEMRYLKYKRK
jgi:hypothetical protein